MDIHIPQAASGFRSHYIHALVIYKQKFTPIFVPSSQSEANRLSLVPLDDLELCYPNRCIRNMEFWFIQDGQIETFVKFSAFHIGFFQFQ